MRYEIKSLTNLHDGQEAGGYSLPNEVLGALRTFHRVSELTVPPPGVHDPGALAAQLVAKLAAGEGVDVAGLVHATDATERSAQATSRAQHIVSLAVEQAGDTAVMIADDFCERIITQHLRPSFTQLLTEVREVAAVLKGHATDTFTMLSAPASVRRAYSKLPDLATRYRALRAARKHALDVGHRELQRDGENLYGEFERPLALRPGYKPPAKLWRLDSPKEPEKFLLWLASDEIAPGRPWLPTFAEQDQAWWSEFGEGGEQRARNHRDGLSIGARIG